MQNGMRHIFYEKQTGLRGACQRGRKSLVSLFVIFPQYDTAKETTYYCFKQTKYILTGRRADHVFSSMQVTCLFINDILWALHCIYSLSDFHLKVRSSMAHLGNYYKLQKMTHLSVVVQFIAQVLQLCEITVHGGKLGGIKPLDWAHRL